MAATLGSKIDERAERFYQNLVSLREPWDNKIRTTARAILRSAVSNRAGAIQVPYDSLLKNIPHLVAQYLNLQLETRWEIPLIRGEQSAFGRWSEIIGVMDRPGRRIIVATKFGFESAYFTFAHEIGHWFLHREFRNLRERLRKSEHTPFIEREADIFAAELIMPSRYLIRDFFRVFGGPVDRDRLTPELAFWLEGSQSPKAVDAFATSSCRYRSTRIAKLQVFDSNPLADRYGVSAGAMARQLEACHLVR